MAASAVMYFPFTLYFTLLLLVSLSCNATESVLEEATVPSPQLTNNIGHRIDGRVEVLSASDKSWMPHIKILVDGGEYTGFLKTDGTFTVGALPSGSYVVEIHHPAFLFEPARVDISSKGKIRGRKVNNLQPGSLKTIAYPLEFRERGKANYFQMREQWRMTDFLFNPMVLTMVLPLLIIMVLPKMMNAADPDTQREVQTQMNALNAKQSLPDMSEFFTSLFSDGKKPIKSKSSSKKR
ncbi:ER membrane protein complex subunit 7 [Octopus bimaculoides]|uniref:ER membrane protein complex subunit 7 beta-sandwich domain-containing protein n=1 Tax=Octopus bimaculoides TaxID=37653 RepID=A0A0L8FT60_OCTBM|nr:ER membrane protein complex subunit 7 [Octopus bimaculoides]|eukprot:XP_014787147.1 PREDICTED: ER membrane protein complex subunit 7-like [Octopus bimaculoides]